MSTSAKIFLPQTDLPIVSIRLKVKGISNSYYFVQMHSIMADGSVKITSETINDNGAYPVHALALVPEFGAVSYYISVSNASVAIDDVELITIVGQNDSLH